MKARVKMTEIRREKEKATELDDLERDWVCVGIVLWNEKLHSSPFRFAIQTLLV